MACTSTAFAPASHEERTRAHFSPETLYRYDTRTTHRLHTLLEFVKERAHECPSAAAAGLKPTLYARVPVRVEAAGRTEFFEVAPVKGWADALKADVEARFGMRCDGLAYGGRPLADCKPFDLVGAPPHGVATISIVGVMRRPLAPAQSGTTVSWSEFRQRVIARLVADLPRVLAKIKPAPGETAVEAAKNFVFTRSRVEPYMRALLRDPTLTVVYDADADADAGQAAWFGAEFVGGDHAQADFARHESVRAANGRFMRAHAIDDRAIDEMALSLSEQTLEALGAPLSGAVAIGTNAPPDEAHIRQAMRAHFTAIGDEGDGSFVLSADRCACARKHGARTRAPPLESAPAPQPPPLETVAAAVSSEMPPLIPIGSPLDSDSDSDSDVDSDVDSGSDGDNDDALFGRTKSKAKKAINAAQKKADKQDEKAALEEAKAKARTAKKEAAVNRARLAYERAAARKPFAGFATAAAPAATPAAADEYSDAAGAIGDEAAAAIGRAMPPTVRLTHTRQNKHEAHATGTGAPTLSQTAPLGDEASAESLVAVSIDNFAPFAAEYAKSRSFDSLIALAPIDSQFTATHAAKMAAMSPKERSAAMAHYMAPDPGQQVRVGAPVAMRTYAGREFALAHEDGTNHIKGLERSAIIDRVQIGDNLVAYTHDNLIGA